MSQNKGVVRIWTKKSIDNGFIGELGTGFVVTSSGIVFTSKHVLRFFSPELIDDNYLEVYRENLGDFDNIHYHFKIIIPQNLEDNNYHYDFAILQILSGKIESFDYVNIDFEPFTTFEESKDLILIGIDSTHNSKYRGKIITELGRLLNPSLIIENCKFLEIKSIVTDGMSGGPVYSQTSENVIGLTVVRRPIIIDTIKEKPETEFKAYAISMRQICEIINNTTPKDIKNELISVFPDPIEFTYVKPLEYDDIYKTLEKYGIVFITGTPEYGKTYTAEFLIMQYIKRGVIPKRIETREAIVKVLKNIEKELRPGYLYYFEDPFGKIEYERNYELERKINSLIDFSNPQKNLYIIITTRSEVLKKFKAQISNEIKGQLHDFEKKLKIITPSYDHGKRKEILINWANYFKCVWMENEDIKSYILKEVEDCKNLPTPLNIKQFALTTKRINNKKDLKLKIDQKSQGTYWAFAQEIKMMSNNQKLFLTFLFISDFFDIEFLKKSYNELISNINLNSFEEFDKILAWFKNEICVIRAEYEISLGFVNYLRFSHPSYYEAFRCFLFEFEDNDSKWFLNNIFFIVLDFFTKQDRSVKDVARTILSNLSNIPERIKENLIIILVKNEKTMVFVAYMLAEKFNEFSEKLRDELLFILAENEKANWFLTKAVSENFDILSKNIRERLLLTFANQERSHHIIPIVNNNFNKLPLHIAEEILIFLSDNERNHEGIMYILFEKFDVISEEVRQKLLLRLTENKFIPREFFHIILKYFNEIPKPFMEKLLLALSKKHQVAVYLTQIIEKYFNNISDALKIELLISLAKNERSAKAVSDFLRINFNNLSESIREDLLNILINKNYTAQNLIKIISIYFEDISDVREKLVIILAEKEEIVEDVSDLFENRFRNFTIEGRRKILFNLAKNKIVHNKLANILLTMFDDFLAEDRETLLGLLANNRDVTPTVVRIIVEKYNLLPEKIRNLLYEFPKQFYFTEDVIYVIIQYFDTIPDSVREELIIILANKERTVKLAIKIFESIFEKLSKESKEKFLITISKKDSTIEEATRFFIIYFNNLTINFKEKFFLTLINNNRNFKNISKVIDEKIDFYNKKIQKFFIGLAKKKNAEKLAYFITDKLISDLVLPDEFPNEFNQLLLSFAKSENTAEFIAQLLLKKYEILPKDVREKLLVSFVGNCGISRSLININKEKYDLIDINLKEKLILTLIENKNLEEEIKTIIKQHPDKFSDKLKNIISVTI